MSAAVPSPTATGRSASRTAAKVRLTARAAMLVVVVLTLLTIAVAPLRALIDQRSEMAELEQQAEDLAAANARLEARIERLNDPTYLERLARECLGMVRPGETAFVIVPARGAPPTPRC
jgi:cell division protein FtsB